MAGRINHSTPKEDGFFMPGEFERQQRILMMWPERPDIWRENAEPAQRTFAEVAKAILKFEPVTMFVSDEQYIRCRSMLPGEIQVVEMSSNDAWIRDTGPSFVINKKGAIRGCDWTFNAWGGTYDGLYTQWDRDDRVAGKVCEVFQTDSYRTDDFVLEGGSFHVDGQGTVLTTEMCLLSQGRNPHLTKKQIEKYLQQYLGAAKIIWLPEGIDPEETNGHVDDVACFVKKGEALCIDTDDKNHPFYQAAKSAQGVLMQAKDVTGKRLRVHKLCCPKREVRLDQSFELMQTNQAKKRKSGDLCIASYANFLLVNGGVIAPQYKDDNDKIALKQLQEIFPERKVVGVDTREIAYGGGNIHCITQQIPEVYQKRAGGKE